MLATGEVPVAGRKRQHDAVPCPNPLHEGSKVKSAGTRRAASGLRRDYVCRPTVGKIHKFAVVIEVEDQPVPLYAPPPACPVHGKHAVRIPRHGHLGTVRQHRPSLG
jgi:hypothetical protein